MKRVFALIAAALICALGVISVAAAPAAQPHEPAGYAAAASGGEVLNDGIVEEEDMVIDLHLATVLIITICSVVAVGIIVTVVILARRNRV